MRQLKITHQITVRESKSITSYFNDINKYDLIQPEEETELAERIQQGDKQALQRLVNGNLRFVVSVAKQYQNKGLTLEDLISEGNIGLVKAAERFDHTKGFKFISYAVWWIRQSIMQALGNDSRAIRLPQNQLQLQRQVARATMDFLQRNERMPTDQEIADIVDAPVHKVSFLNNNNFTGVSADAPMPGAEDNYNLYDRLSSKAITDEHLIDESLSHDLNMVFDKMPKNEAFIIKRFFGIDCPYAMSMPEIAEELDVSTERVRQLKERGLRRIKANEWTKLLQDYV